MKIAFVSNFMNHHQLPLCQEFIKMPNIEFHFIATSPISKERIKLGYHSMNDQYDFIVCSYKSKEDYARALEITDEADVVIIGSAPENFIKKRLKEEKLTFRYSERVYKDGCKLYELPARAVKYFFKHGRHKKLHLLCASAYTASDYAKTLTFIGKAYKWAYFTEVKKYEDIDALVTEKKHNSLIWAGRFIKWKHVELAIETAKYLKDKGKEFTFNIIGTGVNEKEIQTSINALGLGEHVKLLGSMPPEQVRKYMEQSEVFLFTSDRHEGWGAVLNEAMNSACAVVSNIDIGSTPFLVKEGINGYTYKTGDKQTLFQKVEFLLDNAEKRREIAINAYNTMKDEWNAEVAASRFVAIAQELMSKKRCNLYSSGPCSKASNYIKEEK